MTPGREGRRLVIAAESWGPGVLFAVERETAKMLYGKPASGHRTWPTQVRKDDVLLDHASERDHAQLASAWSEKERRIREAHTWYAKRREEICAAVRAPREDAE